MAVKKPMPTRSIRVPESEWSHWAKWAESNGRSISEAIRELMNHHSGFKAAARPSLLEQPRRRNGSK